MLNAEETKCLCSGSSWALIRAASPCLPSAFWTPSFPTRVRDRPTATPTSIGLPKEAAITCKMRGGVARVPPCRECCHPSTETVSANSGDTHGVELNYLSGYYSLPIVIVIIHSLVFSLEGRAWQEPEPSQVTGMALAHCILSKFLGVVCHCFPPPLDVPTLAARCLRLQRRERS